jgi:NADH:ubiquinone oxidoreductase subunit 6 (subunit J)
MVIFSKNSVTSVLYLISVFIFVSLNLLLLEVDFLGILIIIIYIGAISILFLFVIMMLNLRIVEVYSTLIKSLPIGIFLGLFFFLVFIYIIKHDYFILNYIYNDAFELDTVGHHLIFSPSNLYLIGDILFNHFSILLVIAGLILLLAMVGAIVLTRDTSRLPKKASTLKSSISF